MTPTIEFDTLQVLHGTDADALQETGISTWTMSRRVRLLGSL